MSAFATLRGLAEGAQKRASGEHCDMCGALLPERHQHLIDSASRRLVCTCDACTILFHRNGETKYKAVPRTTRVLNGFRLTDGQWDSLLIPIALAFFLRSSIDDRVHAFYPSPAGSTESMLPLEAWTDIAADNSALSAMGADIEALLVNRLADPGEYYLAPIDRCYELVGLIRTNWRGLSGGDRMWIAVRHFFAELKESASA